MASDIAKAILLALAKCNPTHEEDVYGDGVEDDNSQSQGIEVMLDGKAGWLQINWSEYQGAETTFEIAHRWETDNGKYMVSVINPRDPDGPQPKYAGTILATTTEIAMVGPIVAAAVEILNSEPSRPTFAIGQRVTHAGRVRTVTGVQKFGKMTRIWVSFDSRTERSGQEGYFEITGSTTSEEL